MNKPSSFMSRFINDVVKPMMDREYQVRVWAKGEGPECDSLDETFEDFGYYIGILDEEYEEHGLSLEEYLFLKNLEKEFDNFFFNSNFENDEDAIESLEWAKIRKIASEAFVSLKRFESI